MENGKVVIEITKDEYEAILVAVNTMASKGNVPILRADGSMVGKCGVIYGNMTDKIESQYLMQYPGK